MRPVCDDKNCQSTKHMCYDKECHVKSESEGPHFSFYMQSVPKTTCKWMGHSQGLLPIQEHKDVSRLQKLLDAIYP